jgi:rubrerythrin
MQTFIARENLKLYERKLADAVDPDERERLESLINAEREHLRELSGSSPSD